MNSAFVTIEYGYLGMEKLFLELSVKFEFLNGMLFLLLAHIFWEKQLVNLESKINLGILSSYKPYFPEGALSQDLHTLQAFKESCILFFFVLS